jgi:hypothetical protein
MARNSSKNQNQETRLIEKNSKFVMELIKELTYAEAAKLQREADNQDYKILDIAVIGGGKVRMCLEGDEKVINELIGDKNGEQQK